jgi:hypothetical protein
VVEGGKDSWVTIAVGILKALQYIVADVARAKLYPNVVFLLAHLRIKISSSRFVNIKYWTRLRKLSTFTHAQTRMHTLAWTSIQKFPLSALFAFYLLIWEKMFCFFRRFLIKILEAKAKKRGGWTSLNQLFFSKEKRDSPLGSITSLRDEICQLLQMKQKRKPKGNKLRNVKYEKIFIKWNWEKKGFVEIEKGI